MSSSTNNGCMIAGIYNHRTEIKCAHRFESFFPPSEQNNPLSRCLAEEAPQSGRDSGRGPQALWHQLEGEQGGGDGAVQNRVGEQVADLLVMFH